MHFETLAPSELLKPFVKQYWIFENDSEEVEEQKIIPDGFSEMIFHYGEPYQINISGKWEDQDRMLYSNQISRHFYLRNTGRSAMIGIKLQPTGFYQLFGSAQSDYTDQVVPLNTLISVPERIEAMLNPMLSTDQRVMRIEEWLIELPKKKDLFVPKACQLILDNKGLISVEEVAEELSISKRHLERGFKKEVGIPPKLYIRIVKFSTIFQVMQEDKPWVQVALQSGYFDQSHFIKNFQAFTGEDPSAYGFNEQTLANFFMKKT